MVSISWPQILVFRSKFQQSNLSNAGRVSSQRAIDELKKNSIKYAWLRKDAYTGSEVINFFDNLLPDNHQIRDRIAARYKADTKQPFDLLAKVGRDAVGAITLVPENFAVDDHRTITAKITLNKFRLIN